MPNASATNWVSERASQLGLAMAGIARAEKFPELVNQQEWLARGYAGEMKYLSDARRSDPQAALPGARSVIICVLTYNTEHPRTPQSWTNLRNRSETSGPRGWISRYAWGDDYHDVLGEKLEVLVAAMRAKFAEPFETRAYVDTGPVVERIAAKYAGLGWLAKNTCLINEELGSWLFLGVIVTTLELEPSLVPGE